MEPPHSFLHKGTPRLPHRSPAWVCMHRGWAKRTEEEQGSSRSGPGALVGWGQGKLGPWVNPAGLCCGSRNQFILGLAYYWCV